MDGSLDGKEFGKLEMEVNGVAVSDTFCLHKCCALRHDDADQDARLQWKPNDDGRYMFRARITNASKYGFARFSSFIVA